VLGRIVERRRIPLELANATEVRISLDPARAVAVKNELAVRISLDGTENSGTPPRRHHQAAASFILPSNHTAWSDYQRIMWQLQTAAAYRTLKRIGVAAAAVMSDRMDHPGSRVMEQVEAVLSADLLWYLGNTAIDFYASYHRWCPDGSVNWFFEETKRRYWANPDDPAAFMREPSLSDPKWLTKIEHRLTGIVRALRPYRPVFYSLADEPGIADLVAFWDFDLLPASLAAMRHWLKARYRKLGHLNDEWETAFASWHDVVPLTTSEALSEALKRADQNFVAWGDFKAWMDADFARALKRGTEAIHAADPAALSAIEVGQIPGWGGRDYALLADSGGVVEVGDEGEADQSLHSFNPGVARLTTSFGTGPDEPHRVWRDLLRGSRELILWDDKRQFVDEKGNIGQRGRDAACYFGEIRGGLGALLISSRRHIDPIAVLYSLASMRIEWLLDRTRRVFGHASQVKIALDRTAPVILALSEQAFPEWWIAGPEAVRLRSRAAFRRASNRPPTTALDVLYVEAVDPDGTIIPYHNGNRLVAEGAVLYSLPLATNDNSGNWTIRVSILAGGNDCRRPRGRMRT
jgi:hypothetical protein